MRSIIKYSVIFLLFFASKAYGQSIDCSIKSIHSRASENDISRVTLKVQNHNNTSQHNGKYSKKISLKMNYSSFIFYLNATKITNQIEVALRVDSDYYNDYSDKDRNPRVGSVSARAKAGSDYLSMVYEIDLNKKLHVECLGI